MRGKIAQIDDKVGGLRVSSMLPCIYQVNDQGTLLFNFPTNDLAATDTLFELNSFTFLILPRFPYLLGVLS